MPLELVEGTMHYGIDWWTGGRDSCIGSPLAFALASWIPGLKPPNQRVWARQVPKMSFSSELHPSPYRKMLICWWDTSLLQNIGYSSKFLGGHIFPAPYNYPHVLYLEENFWCWHAVVNFKSCLNANNKAHITMYFCRIDSQRNATTPNLWVYVDRFFDDVIK